MIYEPLGNTDISVSKMSLGTWGLGGGSVWSDKTSSADDVKHIIDACEECGVNYIDTAPVYGTGISEEQIGKALQGRRSRFVLQTKCSLNFRNEGGNFHYERDGYTVNNDTSAGAIRKDVQDSLRRMGTDYLDSVVVHYVSKSWSVDETVGALEDMRREGLIRAYGISNSQPENLKAYQSVRDEQGTSLVQEFFSVLSPFHGREYFPVCEEYGTTFQTYGVLEEGFLTGPHFLDRQFAETDIRSRIPWAGEAYRSALRTAFQKWEPLCRDHGCSYAQMAIAWAMAQYSRMNILVGMRKLMNIFDSVKAMDLHFSEEELVFIEDVVRGIQVEVLDK